MKKILYIKVLLLSFIASAQVIKYVDTDIILKKMPQYQQASIKIDEQVKSWQTEIENSQKVLDDEKNKFENEKVLLTEDQIKDKKKEIDSKEKEIKNKIELRFGTNGSMMKLRESLVKPIQDQIMTAIHTLCQKNKIDMVFDKNSDFTMLYSNPRFDLTKDVLKELKLDDKKPKDNSENARN